MPMPPLERNPRYALLDACRGLAALMVVVHHAGFATFPDAARSPARALVAGALRHLDLGVPIFFVISGYCIAASVDATRRRGSRPWRFLARRVWRIYPPYWASVGWFLLATLGLRALGLERLTHGRYPYGLELVPPGPLSGWQWVGNLTLTETWRPRIFGGDPEVLFTRVAWSLCFEEQFYFVCFLVLLVAPRRLYGALAASTICFALSRVAMADVGMAGRVHGTFLDLWHEFAIGLAVYWRLNVPASSSSRRAVEAGLVALLAIAIVEPFRTYGPAEYSTAAASAFGLALIGLRGYDERLARSPWLAPLRACGRRSYGLYLVHLPVCTVGINWLFERGLAGFWQRALVTVPLVSAASVAAGFGFFALVERRFLNPPIVGRGVASGAGPLAGEAPVSGPGSTAGGSGTP